MGQRRRRDLRLARDQPLSTPRRGRGDDGGHALLESSMIDIHTHPVQVAELIARDPGLEAAVHDIFGLYMPPQPLATYLGHLDEAGIDRAVVLPIDCTSAHGRTVVSNEQVAW